MSYTIKKRQSTRGICPPGYEKVKSYNKRSGEHVEEHCRKIRASGRIRAGVSGLYNEGMIAQEDARMGFDSIIDSTKAGEQNADRIKARADHVEDIMRDQERKKEEAREKER